MKITSLVGAAVAGLIVAAGVALAGNFSSNRQSDFDSPGAHQFYVWCSGSPDYMAIQSGSSASDAQMRLYEAAKRSGKTTCWPMWQGRLSG
ncbi:MAG TPA: hypothetical protein VG843_12830 [Rhizomicrobium sp.]|nr:hypothetical protein [Rhizomicrobium sp.]